VGETLELGYYRKGTANDLYFVIEILDAHSINRTPLLSLDKNIQWTIVGFCWLFLLIGTYFRYLLYSFLYGSYKAKDNKPIDKLILVLTLIQHISIVLVVIRITLLFSYEAKLHETVGEWYCTMNDVIYTFDLYYSYIGSLGLSLFRILYIKCNVWIKYRFGEKRFLYIILFGGLSLAAIFVTNYSIHDYSKIQGANCMAADRMLILGHFLEEYAQSQGNVTHFSDWLTRARIIVLILMAMTLVEITLYFVYFHHIYRNDNKETLKLALGPTVIRRRNRKNAITFFGQFCSFVFEFSITVFLIIAFAFMGLDSSDSAQVTVSSPIVFIRALFFSLRAASFTAISIVEVLTSSNLRSRIKIPFRSKKD